MNIPMDATLVYVKDSDITVKVVSPNKVLYNSEEYSLSALTKSLLDLPYYVSPTRYWTYEGKNLQAIYDDTYTRPVSE